jgi:DNA-binding transcriptional regulator LsrR (DeoR family)
MTDDQLLVRVAWLYYMEGLTQDRIGTRLRLTRLRVNRLLAEARQSGLVSVTINANFTSCLALEDALRRRFGLREAVIVPTPYDIDLIPGLLGRAAAAFLSRQLEERTIRGLGVGWGATLREMIRHVRPTRQPDLVVNSVMGGLTRGLEINTFEIASALAGRLESQCTYLAAPLYASSARSRDLIAAQPVFREAFERISTNDFVVLSVGDLSDRSLLVRYGLPGDVTVASLRKAGAVGDIVGQFLDAGGRLVDHPLNQRALAPSVVDLARYPMVVVASGGRNKVDVIAAVLRARLTSVLICDEDTAAAAMRKCGEGRDARRSDPGRA